MTHQPDLTTDDQMLHPRPQSRRSSWTDLCGDWQFAYDDEDRGLREHWQERGDAFSRSIRVPYPPESPLSGIGDTTFHPIVWYRRTVAATTPPAGGRVLLHFGAIDYRA